MAILISINKYRGLNIKVNRQAWHSLLLSFSPDAVLKNIYKCKAARFKVTMPPIVN